MEINGDWDDEMEEIEGGDDEVDGRVGDEDRGWCMG